MRIHTLLEFQITEHGLELIREEGYEYCGPLDLCDRGQSAQVVKQGTEQSAQNASNAQTADTATNTAVGQYNQRLNDFMRFGRQTYGANGEFMRDANTLGTTTARAGSAGIGANLATNAMRTGDNTANYANVAAESQRSADRDLTTQLASADQQRLSQLTAINQYGVQASQFPAQVQAQLYGTSTSGEGSNLSPASSASMAPSGWDVFGQDLAAGVGAAAGAYCPCAGSLIRMADGTHAPVEELKKGAHLFALGLFLSPNELLETPVPVLVHCFRVTTVSGRKHEGSNTHTMALATGGYTYMPESLGRAVMTEHGAEQIVRVEDLGGQLVYPMAVAGSHSYMADGIWILA